MLIRKDQYFEVYQQVQRLAFKTRVIIFASARDVDAICAFKIITTLFKLDSIGYTIVPVSDYDHLQSQVNQLLDSESAEDDDPVALLFLNCGGGEDLSGEVLPRLPNNSRVVVIDSHRPLSLQNVSETNSQVLVLHDDIGEFFPDTRDDDEGQDELEDSEEPERETSRRRLNEEGDFERGERRRAIEDYYKRGSFYGKAAGWIMYDLAIQLHRENRLLLWCAIVSLTDQHLHGRITQETYDYGYGMLSVDVVQTTNSSITLEDGTQVPVAADSQIKCGVEYIFYHLRHWTLAEAMSHAPYVASTLKTWEEKGTRKLHKLFARMGLPLQACHQKFTHMSSSLVSKLSEKFDDFGREVGLVNIYFNSFYTERGHKLQLSASDVALGIAALLEGPEREATKTAGGVSVPGTDWTDHWGRACDALSTQGDSWAHLNQGIHLSMAYQRTIVTQAGQALMRKRIVGEGPRLYKLLDLREECSALDAGVLQHPLILQRLALFLQEEISAGKSRRRAIVVIAPDSGLKDNDGWSYSRIIGVTGRPQLGDSTYNRFAVSFSLAADRSEASFKFPTFDMSIVDVRSDDVKAFLDELREVEYEAEQGHGIL